jgi:Tfp pilus assembly protein PilX
VARPLDRSAAEPEALQEANARVRTLEILLAEERSRARHASEAAWRDVCDMRNKVAMMEEQLRHALMVAHDRGVAIETLEAQLKDKTQSLQAVYASTSWRISSPVRALAGLRPRRG